MEINGEVFPEIVKSTFKKFPADFWPDGEYNSYRGLPLSVTPAHRSVLTGAAAKSGSVRYHILNFLEYRKARNIGRPVHPEGCNSLLL